MLFLTIFSLFNDCLPTLVVIWVINNINYEYCLMYCLKMLSCLQTIEYDK